GRVPELAPDDSHEGQDVQEADHVSTVLGSGRCDQSETVNAIAMPVLQHGSRCDCRMNSTITLVMARPPLAISRSSGSLLPQPQALPGLVLPPVRGQLPDHLPPPVVRISHGLIRLPVGGGDRP